MRSRGRTQRPFLLALPPGRFALAFVMVVAVSAADQPTQGRLPWRVASESVEVARVRGDWTAYARYVDAVFAGIGNYPTVIWAQARAAARLGNHQRALERMTVYAAMGISRDPWSDSAFLPFRDSPSWQRVAARLAEFWNREV